MVELFEMVKVHGKSLINGGFNGKIIYHGPCSMAMLNNQRVFAK